MQQKQVAKLLGHRKAEALSRYESGTKMPSLRTALKLAIIYDIPIRTMLDGYYEACRAEILQQEKTLGKGTMRARDSSGSSGYCSFEEQLKTDSANEIDLQRAHKHTVDMVRLRGEKIDRGFSTARSSD